MQTKTFKIVSTQSNIEWVGKKVTGAHTGTIAVKEGEIEGNLTIKGITQPAGFDVAVNVNGDQLTATGKLVIDRTKYEMKFRSGNFFKDLGDNLIYNDFELNVSVTAKAA